MEEPKPQKNSRQEELEGKIADLVAEALYQRISKQMPLPKEKKEHN